MHFRTLSIVHDPTFWPYPTRLSHEGIVTHRTNISRLQSWVAPHDPKKKKTIGSFHISLPAKLHRCQSRLFQLVARSLQQYQQPYGVPSASCPRHESRDQDEIQNETHDVNQEGRSCIATTKPRTRIQHHLRGMPSKPTEISFGGLLRWAASLRYIILP